MPPENPREPDVPALVGVKPREVIEALLSLKRADQDIKEIKDRLNAGDRQFKELHGSVSGVKGGVDALTADVHTLTAAVISQAEARGRQKAATSALQWAHRNWPALVALALWLKTGVHVDWAAVKAFLTGQGGGGRVP